MKKPNEDISQLYNTLEKALVDSGSLSNSDKLTKYVVAKALLNGTQDEDGLRGLVSDIEGTPVYQHFSLSNSIFSNEFQEYVKFEFRTEGLNFDILKDTRYFKIPEAKKKKRKAEVQRLKLI